MVTAVVSLNISLSDWQNNVNQIQDKVKNAIAAAAGVSADKVILGRASARGSNRRRLLIYEGKGIDVVANVVGAREIQNLDEHIRSRGISSKGHVWSANHMVLNRKMPKHHLQRHFAPLPQQS